MEPFNAIDFKIFNIPGYLFFAYIGIVTATCAFILLLSEKKYPLNPNLKILPFSFVIALISSKLFGCISGIYRDIGLEKPVALESIINTGIVYYGGLIGFLFAYGFLSKKFHSDRSIMDILAVCIPLFHAFARIGCFTGGCCYGIESDFAISVNYTTTIMENTVTAYRIPVQFIEAGFNVILFLYLFRLLKSENWKSKNLLKRYLLLYSIGRFLIEFLRGDLERGVICGISFSQVISIFIWVYLAINIIRRKFFKQETDTNLAE